MMISRDYLKKVISEELRNVYKLSEVDSGFARFRDTGKPPHEDYDRIDDDEEYEAAEAGKNPEAQDENTKLMYGLDFPKDHRDYATPLSRYNKNGDWEEGRYSVLMVLTGDVDIAQQYKSKLMDDAKRKIIAFIPKNR